MAERGTAELERLERWMQAVLTHPDGVRAGVATEAARSALDQPIAAVVTPSAALDAEQRVAIYSSMYFERLLEVLEEDFPALAAALGEDDFRRLRRDYVVAHPPSHYSLNELGRELPAFLKDGELSFEPPARAFLAELAALERALQEVFDAPAAEPLDAAALERVPPADWAGARLALVPAVRLFAFEHPVNAWLTAQREADQAPPPPARGRSWVVVHRRELRVRRTDLGLEQHALLDALADGVPLGAALERAASADGADADRLAEVGRWFHDWAAAGLFAKP